MKDIHDFLVNENKVNANWRFVYDIWSHDDGDKIHFDEDAEYLEFYPIDKVIQLMTLDLFKDEDVADEMISEYGQSYYNKFIDKVSSLKYGESYYDDKAKVIILKIKK